MIFEEIMRNEAYGIQIRRILHENPELGNQEYDTTALIRRELTEIGADIRDCGLETGVLAEIKGIAPGKVIAIRADIDALPVQEKTGLEYSSKKPGISHSCGHDMHTAALLLAAKVLAEHRSEMHGAVRLMFQPAEEIGTGAKTMIAHGAMENPRPDLVLAVHTWPDTPAGMIGVKAGASHASSDTVIIKVKGKGGHGAHPYRCVDPIIVAAYMLTQMQTIISRELPMVQGGVLTFGSIHGGTAANVIPGEVEIKGTLRSTDPKWRASMLDSIRRIAVSCCEAMRAEAEVTIIEGMPPLVNTEAVIAGIKAAASHVIGEENVMDLPNCSPGSDDFAFYQELAPGALFRMGTGNADPVTHIGLHNGGNVFDEKGIAAAAAVLVQYILERLSE